MTENDEERAPGEMRLSMLLSLLERKGVVTEEAIQRAVEEMDATTPALGARAVGRAWSDPGFKELLLSDAHKAFAQLGVDYEYPPIAVLENTERVHHVVTCTLCSCYPRAVLGLPPAWYKSLEYRARAIRDPRGVLEEFGLNLDPDVEVRVVDSTADLRYLVLPRRPPETEGWDEERLASLVTRDSMIGTGLARAPR